MGVKPSKKGDRRVQRTHRVLGEALVELILERGWDKVSVQDVCDRADVGRSTFYMHFADKEELLVGGLDGLRRFLRERQSPRTGGGPLAFAGGMFEHAHEQRDLFRAVIGKRSGQVVQKRFRQLLTDLVREDLAGLVPPGPRLDGAVSYVSGAFFEFLIWWIDARSPIQLSEAVEMFRRLTTPVLSSLRGK